MTTKPPTEETNRKLKDAIGEVIKDGDRLDCSLTIASNYATTCNPAAAIVMDQAQSKLREVAAIIDQLQRSI